MVLTFFALLSLSARELVYTDLYIRAKYFWMVTLVFGGLAGLGLAAFLFKKTQLPSERLRLSVLMLIFGICAGPGFSGLINRINAVPTLKKEFIVLESTPYFEGRGISPFDLETPDTYKVVLDSGYGKLVLRLPPEGIVSSLKPNDRIQLQVMEGLLGFAYFDKHSLQKY